MDDLLVRPFPATLDDEAGLERTRACAGVCPGNLQRHYGVLDGLPPPQLGVSRPPFSLSTLLHVYSKLMSDSTGRLNLSAYRAPLCAASLLIPMLIHADTLLAWGGPVS
jgi:hypothetical protein